MSKPTSFSITLSSSLDDRTTQNGLSYILNSIGRHDTFFVFEQNYYFNENKFYTT